MAFIVPLVTGLAGGVYGAYAGGRAVANVAQNEVARMRGDFVGAANPAGAELARGAVNELVNNRAFIEKTNEMAYNAGEEFARGFSNEMIERANANANTVGDRVNQMAYDAGENFARAFGNEMIERAVHKLVSKEQIHELGRIIAQYGYEDAVWIAVAHRHFLLFPGEAMLEMKGAHGDGSISRPASLDIIENVAAVPNVIALDVVGTKFGWFPVNYVVGKMPEAFEDEVFLTACAEFLLKHDLFGKLVLGTANRHPEGKLFVEENDEETRTSVTRPIGDGEMPSDHAIDAWFAVERGPKDEIQMFVVSKCD